MDNFENYSLELEKYANNFGIKGQDYSHILNKELIFAYKNANFSFLSENELFDAMGDDELKKYEKWLMDGRF